MCPFGSSRKGFSLAATKPRLGFIGAGKTGGALARALAAAGYLEIVIASRGRASADALVSGVTGGRSVGQAQEAVDAADIVFITTPDDAIERVVRSLNWLPGKSVVHTSGAESREVLAYAATAGAETASLHPLQTFAGAGRDAASLRGITFALEAEEPLKGNLLEIVNDLGGVAVELESEDRPLYHASAVLASNYVVTLTKLATDLWASFGQEKSVALQALLPLLRGTVANLEATGLPNALTGPIERGDVAIVERHMKALTDLAPGVVGVYRELGSQTITIALEKGSIDEAGARLLRGALSGQPAECKRESAGTDRATLTGLEEGS
jgi:predicted short-subunit dehydrogenase-like oxidoreductase (DUF2520 family)